MNSQLQVTECQITSTEPKAFSTGASPVISNAHHNADKSMSTRGIESSLFLSNRLFKAKYATELPECPDKPPCCEKSCEEYGEDS